MVVKACIFDIGGVCVLSPLHAIRAYETKNSIPRGYISYAIATSSPSGSWDKLERGEIPMNSGFFAGFTSDLTNPETWNSFLRSRNLPEAATPPPRIDGEALFWQMMTESRVPNLPVVAAIRKLRATGRYKVAALTNDFQFPQDHPFADRSELRGLFDVFVSSSECGMRKPERGIYRLVLERLGVTPGEAVFLDDLGLNLKAARELGIITVRVPLEETWRAVRELEAVLGEKLLDEEEEPVGEKAKL
ncbi:HAD-like domain-containing protein [Tuber borchii]|uniref:HAD-like domain-containing protein n=1 Tax=Tuber borchii TaxID=42251 RepID=A0A2T7A0X4_TUBBO|nr:HAD-like domain-containing protein [Tuber borchii]